MRSWIQIPDLSLTEMLTVFIISQRKHLMDVVAYSSLHNVINQSEKR